MAKQPEGKWIPIHLFRKNKRSISSTLIEKTIKEGTGKNVKHELSYKKLQSTVQEYAKRANSRLKGIEKAELTESSNAYRWVESMAYGTNKAHPDVKAAYLTENKRFKTNKNRSYDELFEELKRLEYFLFRSKTSSAAKTQSTNIKRAKTSIEALRKTGEEYKIKLAQILESEVLKDDKKLNAYGEWWRSSALAKLIHMYGSSQGVDAYEKGFTEAKELDNLLTKEVYDSKVIEYLSTKNGKDLLEGNFKNNIPEYATQSITEEDSKNISW